MGSAGLLDIIYTYMIEKKDYRKERFEVWALRFYDFAGNSCLASLDIAWDDDRMIMMISVYRAVGTDLHDYDHRHGSCAVSLGH